MIKKPKDLLSKRVRMVADLIEEGVVIAVASHLNLADSELEVNHVRVASRAVEVDHLKSRTSLANLVVDKSVRNLKIKMAMKMQLLPYFLPQNNSLSTRYKKFTYQA